jgi:aryl-alcohol dehydrogenase-like predicted oxidoreductase
MPLDHYVTLGKSGLRVSPMCLGAMTFGEDWGWGSSVADSQAILDRFLDRGGNFIDTANAYTKGHSEKIIGDHLGRHPSKRDRAVLATKFLSNLYRGDPNGGGSHRKAIVSACEQSLRRLQTSYIDLLEEMDRIAKSLGSTVARVALAWVQSRPGVASTIIGARTLAQLEDNLAGLEVHLEPADLAKLDALSKPTLNFPADFIANGAFFVHGGTTINGRSAQPWPLSPKDDSERY